MTRVRSYTRGHERKVMIDNVHYELWLEPILRQLVRDIQEAVMEFMQVDGDIL